MLYTLTIQLTNTILLHNVLFVPDFHFCLTSVNKLCFDLHLKLIFSVDKCFAQDLVKKETSLLGKLRHGLYYANLSSRSPPASIKPSCFVATDSPSLKEVKLLHLRLGHLSLQQLEVLYPDISVKDFKDSIICSICPAVK